MEKNSQVKATGLQFFPVMMFAIVMGLSGLTILYQKAVVWLSFSHFLSQSLIWLDSLIFMAIIGVYIFKIIKYPNEVKKEFSHPVKINFFAAISISFLLFAVIFNEEKVFVGKYFWYIGAILQTFFTFYIISFWINKNLEINHSNPAWFIPIVGNVIAPIGGVGVVSNEILMYFFSIGIFFWIILLAIVLNRIIFHNQLAQKFMPTLFIFIAPPAVGLVSYVKMTNNYDLFASFLYNLGLFFTILLIFMFKNFVKIKFFISWWAFTFPLAAFSISTLLTFHKTQNLFYKYLGITFIIITSLVVIGVAYQTIKHMLKHEICIAE